MRSRILSIFAMSIFLIAGESQAQTVVFDNLTAASSATFNNTANAAINPARYLLGEDISTIAPTNSGDTWRVDSVDFNFLAFGSGAVGSNNFDNIEVEVTFWGGVTGTGGNALGTAFGNATNLGSETFDLQTLINTGFTTVNQQTVNFTNGIDIGDGQNLGVTFALTEELADGTRSARSDRLAVAYRATSIAFPAPTPFVGTTTDRNFRDLGGALGVIDGTDDDFGFGADIGLAFRVNATAVSAVPEPASLSVLGLLALGLITRRRR